MSESPAVTATDLPEPNGAVLTGDVGDRRLLLPMRGITWSGVLPIDTLRP
jgi:hypothetical protein